MKHARLIVVLVLIMGTIPATSQAGLKVGAQAPDFTLLSTSDDTVSLSDYRGQIVILHFWKSN